MNRKVLIIVENMPAPFDFRVWKEARSLHGAGYQVVVLCPRGAGYRKGYEFLNGIHVYRHPLTKEGNSHWGYLVDYTSALFWEVLRGKHKINSRLRCK